MHHTEHAPLNMIGFIDYAAREAALIQSYTTEQTPKSTMPAVQMARASLVLPALWKVGNGLSLCLMNMAFTMSK